MPPLERYSRAAGWYDLLAAERATALARSGARASVVDMQLPVGGTLDRHDGGTR